MATLEERRAVHSAAYSPWRESLDDALLEGWFKGATEEELAEWFGRSVGAIRSRINRHGREALREKLAPRFEP